MTMRMLALAVVAGVLVSLAGCGSSETGTASRRRGLFQGRNKKRNSSELASERPGRGRKAEKTGAADDPDGGIRRELEKLRAEELAQVGRVRELRTGLTESENQADLEEEKLEAIRQRIERYELALGERSRASLPSRDTASGSRAGADDDSYASDRDELADRGASRSYGRGGSRDEETLSAPRAYNTPPRAEVRNIPDPRQYSEDREVVVWQPPASPFTPGSASQAEARRPSLSSMTAPTFPPPRPPSRQSTAAPAAQQPTPPVAAVSEIPYERREVVAPPPMSAPPAPIGETYYEEPARSDAGEFPASTLRPPFAAPAEQPVRPSAAAPAQQSQSLRPPSAPAVREEWPAAEPDAFGASSSEVFVPDLYLGGGR